MSYPEDHGDLAELFATFSSRIQNLQKEMQENPGTAEATAARIEKQALERAQEKIMIGKEATEEDYV